MTMSTSPAGVTSGSLEQGSRSTRSRPQSDGWSLPTQETLPQRKAHSSASYLTTEGLGRKQKTINCRMPRMSCRRAG